MLLPPHSPSIRRLKLKTLTHTTQAIMGRQETVIHGDNLRKGPWLEEEDEQLVSFVTLFGERKWDFIATASGLKRNGKSCRLRWLNYLRPNLKRGHISAEEEQIIIQLHELWGNKWAKIARRLPGRTDNEIKNYWRTHLRKKMQAQEGNFQGKVNSNSKRDEEGNTSSWNFSAEDFKSINEENTGSRRVSEIPSLTFMNSPYENRLYDWMSSELSSDQNEVKIHRDCGGSGSCLCYLKWNAEDADICILDSLGSLWDMN